MIRVISSMEDKYLIPALDLIEGTFTQKHDHDEGMLVRNLVMEIRSKKYYIPKLELVMLDQSDNVIGYAMFSGFHIEGKYEDELLMLDPVAVKYEYQRQHISKELIERGFDLAREMGYKAVFVEGDPKNYTARGFMPSYRFGITASPNLRLPHPDCLMITELVEGALEKMSGQIDYGFYATLSN